jgi:hypothetical protein
MQVSLNEVAGMAAKAACGAGRPWGLAQEAGWAVAWLEAMGCPVHRRCWGYSRQPMVSRWTPLRR